MAQALERMPQVRDSFVNGEVSSSAVGLLAEARREHPGEFAVGEEALVDAARAKPVEELRRVVSEWVQAVDGRSGDRAEILRSRRSLGVCPTPTRMVHVQGELDPEGGEALLTALQAMIDADLRAAGGLDLRTPTQRRADALHELARRYLDSPDRPAVAGERPHITLTVDAASLNEAEPTGREPEPKHRELEHTGRLRWRRSVGWPATPRSHGW